MELSDALVITALGMAVVFTGLLLTSLLIVSFNLLPKLHRRDGVRGPATVEPTPADAAQAPAEPAVVAVITTVIEVERRLHGTEIGGRLTINRDR